MNYLVEPPQHRALCGLIPKRFVQSRRIAVEVPNVQLAAFDERNGPHPRTWPHAKIGDIVVTREHRRSGVGRMLMAAASDWAKARGAAEIELTVWDFNRDATALYESLGFQATKRTMLRRLD